ncbi:hypothetical protein LOAG_03496 [Loa loa]|uniref:Uncharacterized protein n=1 Tax=Loa loa TaxID=7209 RepID=A0A1S0U688_LOALO|nr:hypothetical protein LOAG_03496 [Loa loa]EFO24991.1 hypothetical protein LOAG_03496 [Loa loa]
MTGGTLRLDNFIRFISLTASVLVRVVRQVGTLTWVKRSRGVKREMQHTRKALGCLYGQVIGDSLGSRYEFQPASVVQQMIINDSVQSFLPMIGGGPFQLLPGQPCNFLLHYR